MDKTVTVDKIMTKKVITIQKDAPVCEAANLLVNNKISGLPVLNENDHLVGIITEKDIMHLLLEEYISEMDPVSKFMTHDVKHFSATESIANVTKFLLNSHYRRVPIVSRNKVIGIVARRDVLKLILQVRGADYNNG